MTGYPELSALASAGILVLTNSPYKLRTYFIINIPRCGPDFVFDARKLFLCFNAYKSDGTGVLVEIMM